MAKNLYYYIIWGRIWGMFVIEIRTPDPTPDSPGINQSDALGFRKLSLFLVSKKKKSGGNQATAACMKIFFCKAFLGGCERGVMSVPSSGMIPLALAGRPDSCVSAQV